VAARPKAAAVAPPAVSAPNSAPSRFDVPL
jgi:hypothetical protein